MPEDYLSHHGILGQKWGIRRYQNADGSYTDAGKRRYTKLMQRAINKADKQAKQAAIKDGTEIGIRFDGKKTNHYGNADKAMKKVLADPDYKKAAADANKLEKAYKKEFTKIWDKYHHDDPQFGTAGWLDLAEVPSTEKIAYQQSWEKAFPAIRKRDQLLQKSLQKNGQELLSAKLKDIGFDDTETNRQMLKDIYVDKYGPSYWYLM